MSRTWHRKRKEKYTGAKRFDPTCRNHGSCSWCHDNRTHKHRKARPADEKRQIEEGYAHNRAVA